MLLQNKISRSSAQRILSEPGYDISNYNYDVDYIARKLQIPIKEFESYLGFKGKDPKHFKNNNYLYRILKKIKDMIEKIFATKLSNYK